MTMLVNATQFHMRGSLHVLTERIVINEYNSPVNNIPSNMKVDISTLTVTLALNRAGIIEKEIQPLYNSITMRNTYLDELGKGLAAASDIQAACQNAGKDGKPGSVTDDVNGPIVNSTTLKYCGRAAGFGNTFSPGQAAWAVQILKSKIDSFNNAAQQDMNRLQSIVEKRDNSFTLASDLSSGFSDTRSAAIRNIGN